MSEIACPNTLQRWWSLKWVSEVGVWLASNISHAYSFQFKYKCLQPLHPKKYWQENCSEGRRLSKLKTRESLRDKKILVGCCPNCSTLKYLLAKPWGDVFSCHKNPAPCHQDTDPWQNRSKRESLSESLCFHTFPVLHTRPSADASEDGHPFHKWPWGSIFGGGRRRKLSRGWVPFLWVRLRILQAYQQVEVFCSHPLYLICSKALSCNSLSTVKRQPLYLRADDLLLSGVATSVEAEAFQDFLL